MSSFGVRLVNPYCSSIIFQYFSWRACLSVGSFLSTCSVTPELFFRPPGDYVSREGDIQLFYATLGGKLCGGTPENCCNAVLPHTNRFYLFRLLYISGLTTIARPKYIICELPPRTWTTDEQMRSSLHGKHPCMKVLKESGVFGLKNYRTWVALMP